MLRGIIYNMRGLWLGIRTPSILFLGMLRFGAVILLTILFAGLILIYHQQILTLLWARPDSPWILWLWHTVAWLLSIALVALAALLSYLISQLLFSVFIMDQMSRITERKTSGMVNEPQKVYALKRFAYLLRQEIPRSLLPVALSLAVMILGWLTPLGPIIALLSSLTAVIFIAWDNTDLLPARRMVPFKGRVKLLSRNLPFHLGFGLLFLIPGLNIIFLSFAPVGGTLYSLDTCG